MTLPCSRFAAVGVLHFGESMSLLEARKLYRRARDSGFYPVEDLELLAERLPADEWPLAEVELLVSDAEQQMKDGRN
jgi:hypothetical protein